MYLVNVNDDIQNRIVIGRLGENLATQVSFNIAEWISIFGEGMVSLLVKRPSDNEPYPVDLNVQNDLALWTVQSSDVSEIGIGQAELVYSVGEIVVKSKIYALEIQKALEGSADIPKPYENYVQTIIRYGSMAKESSQAAAISENNAKQSEESVEQTKAQIDKTASAIESAREEIDGKTGSLTERIKSVEDELPNKQDRLTAGENITIEGNVISAKGGDSKTLITVDVNSTPSNPELIPSYKDKDGNTLTFDEVFALADNGIRIDIPLMSYDPQMYTALQSNQVVTTSWDTTWGEGKSIWCIFEMWRRDLHHTNGTMNEDSADLVRYCKIQFTPTGMKVYYSEECKPIYVDSMEEDYDFPTYVSAYAVKEYVDPKISDINLALSHKAEQSDVTALEQRVTATEEDVVGLTTTTENHDSRIHTIERQLGHIEVETADIDDIIANVQSGRVKDFYDVGEQIVLDYNYSGTVYSCEHNIVDRNDVLDENGQSVHGLTLEWEWATPVGIPFDPDEALYCVGSEGLPTGTYHFTVQGDSWASQNGKTYQFTVTNALTEGMQLKPSNTYNTLMTTGQMRVYADYKSFSALYNFSITEGNGGTNLGTMGTGKLNHYHKVFLGYNRYKDSFIRQWLNSTGVGADWYHPTSEWDRPTSNFATLKGFLDGYSAEFVSKLKPVMHKVYRNTITDDGGLDVVVDRVFIASFAEWNCNTNQVIQYKDGEEGKAWEYYEELATHSTNLATNGAYKWGTTYPELISYALNSKTSAQYVFSRSSNRSTGNNVCGVHASGYVHSTSAYYSNRIRPACVIR